MDNNQEENPHQQTFKIVVPRQHEIKLDELESM